MITINLRLCGFMAVAILGTSSVTVAAFGSSIPVTPSTQVKSGAAGLWDGYENVFYGEGDALVQKYWGGSSWITSVVDRPSSPVYSSCNTGTTGEISGKFVGGYHDIFYIARNSVALRHAYYDWGAGVWQCETIASNSTFTHPVALDVGGYPHVYYVDVGAGRLRHTFWTGNNWQSEDIDGLGLTGSGRCNCRVGGLASAVEKTVAAVTFGGYQQVFYGTNPENGDVLRLRHAYKAGGGGGAWVTTTIDGPGSGMPGATLSSFNKQITATVVSNTLHVFASFVGNLQGGSSSGVRHIWWNGSAWRLGWFSGPRAWERLSVTQHLGGYALSTVGELSGAGSHYWGQGDQYTSRELLQFYPYNLLTDSAYWIDSYVGGDGYLNVYVTFKSGNMWLMNQFWK